MQALKNENMSRVMSSVFVCFHYRAASIVSGEKEAFSTMDESPRFIDFRVVRCHAELACFFEEPSPRRRFVLLNSIAVFQNSEVHISRIFLMCTEFPAVLPLTPCSDTVSNGLRSSNLLNEPPSRNSPLVAGFVSS